MITKNIPILPFLASVKLWGIVGYLNPFTNPKNALGCVRRHKNSKSWCKVPYALCLSL